MSTLEEYWKLQGPMFDEQGEPFDWRLYQAGINENNYYPGIEEDIYDDDDDDDD